MIEKKPIAFIDCDMFSKATKNGNPINQPIKIGNSVVCDGYLEDKGVREDNRTTAVFTHFHDDHTWNYSNALRHCNHILMTELTYEAIKALKNLPDRPSIEKLPYNRPFQTGYGETVELIDANHVPGSCQVLVTMEETNQKILYSGDFSFPEIPTPKTDILILDGTHGTDSFDFDTDKQSVLNRIFDEVFEQIENDNPVEILANRGTMQEIMAYLHKTIDGRFIADDIPFLAESSDVNLTNAIKSFYDDVKFRELSISNNSILNDLYDEHKPYIRFARPHYGSAQQERAKIIQADVNPNFKSQGAFWTDKNGKVYACLAAHATFDNVIKYVKSVDPEKVIVDGTRVSYDVAESLANTLSKKLGIVAFAHNCKS